MRRPVSFSARIVRLAALLSLSLAAACGVTNADGSQPSVSLPHAAVRAGLDPALRHGADLYDRHCALCHGVWGAGDGMAGSVLYPPARDFAVGAFSLVSTTNGMPTESDLVATLRRGMPGSAMPGWAWMADDDLRALAGYVRHLTVEGVARGLAEQPGRAVNAPQARRLAHDLLRAGDQVAVVDAAPATPANLDRGRGLYAEHCAGCHGADAKGQLVPSLESAGPRTNRTRDLTRGPLEGGASAHALSRRIRAGMPAVGMPPTALSDQELAALVTYVQSLLPADVDRQGVQVRQRVVAARTSAPVPSEPDDARWERAPALDLVLTPLWRTDAAIVGANLAALHDGESLALRLSWNDATRDDDPIGDLRFRDAVAVQVSKTPDPPLFGMGDAERPVEIWHWRSVRLRDVAGMLDLIEQPPHGRISDAPRMRLPIYRPSLADGPRRGSAETLSAQGFERLGSEPANGSIVSRAAWSAGRWSVVLVRRLEPDSARELSLAPGERVQFGCAIWNGAAHDHRAHKSITIWHELELAR